MQKTINILSLLLIGAFTWIASANAATITGQLTQWHPITIDFSGPFNNETDSSPNPFMDYRLVVEFTSPGGSVTQVPGFFAGNGQGGGSGDIWRARFSADQPGTWRYRANFRQATDAAINLDFNSGNPTSFHGEEGTFTVNGVDPSSNGFLRYGRLDYVGDHYLKFRNGPYWIKTGTDSPENFLAYAGFDATFDQGGVREGFIHRYDAHRGDFRDGDPLFSSADTGVDSRGIIGSLNYLSDRGVNSIYFLPMNLGGDGYDTHPFLAPERTEYFKTHFDVSKLHQWNQVLSHAQNRGIALNIVLNETEIENREWQDNGLFGRERQLYYRELIARFGYLLAAKWNISEENNFPVDFVREAAFYLSALDWSNKPVTLHTPPDRFENYFALLGNPLITATSIQYSIDRASEYTEEWRQRSRDAGVPWVVDLDENDVGLLDNNTDDLRRRVLYDVLFSGGNVEWYFGFGGPIPGGDITVEDFRTRETMWNQSRFARELMERELPFNRMQPMDNLVSNENLDFGGAEVFAAPNEIYAVYLPNASGNAQLQLPSSTSTWRLRWFNPVSGQFEREELLQASGSVSLSNPPSAPDRDWVVLVDSNNITVAANNPPQQVDPAPAQSPPLPAPPIDNTNMGSDLRIEGLNDVNVTPGSTASLRLQPFSSNGQVPSMYLLDAPASAQFNDNGDGSRTFLWQPGSENTGTTRITVVASDPSNPGNRIERQFNVAVGDGGGFNPSTNQSAPENAAGLQLVLPATASVRVGETLAVVVAPSDTDGSVPGVRLETAPASATFDDNGNGTRTLRWTPVSTDIGNHQLVFVAEDALDSNQQLRSELTVTVNP